MFVLDLGATMTKGPSPRLPHAKNALKQFLIQKVMAKKKSDEVAVVVVGHPDTDNTMNEEVGWAALASTTPGPRRRPPAPSRARRRACPPSARSVRVRAFVAAVRGLREHRSPTGSRPR